MNWSTYSTLATQYWTSLLTWSATTWFVRLLHQVNSYERSCCQLPTKYQHHQSLFLRCWQTWRFALQDGTSKQLWCTLDSNQWTNYMHTTPTVKRYSARHLCQFKKSCWKFSMKASGRMWQQHTHTHTHSINEAPTDLCYMKHMRLVQYTHNVVMKEMRYLTRWLTNSLSWSVVSNTGPLSEASCIRHWLV